MPDTTPVELIYDGDDVNDGTVPVEYMIDALVGFSSAYGKIASKTQPGDVAHRIRVVGIKHNSAHILVDVAEWVRVNPGAAGVMTTAAGLVGAGAYRIISDIAKVIIAKKHLKGKPLEQPSIVFNGPTIVIVNETKDKLELTKEQLEFLQTGLLDPDLDKLTAPLEEGRVNEFELKTGKKSLAKVEADERQYFVHSEPGVTTSKDEMWLEGTINSLTKDRNRGTFHTLSGKHIPYRYVGDDQHSLLKAFSYEGIVRARAKVAFDSELNPTFAEIQIVEPGQRRLPY